MDRPAQWALVGAAWFLAISVAVFGYLTWQRMAPPRPAAASSGASAADPSAWSPQPDGTALCPVTGRRVQVTADTPKLTYLGHVYYFAPDKDADGQDARTRFLMDPESYLKRPADAP